jgi:hypothetical protein
MDHYYSWSLCVNELQDNPADIRKTWQHLGFDVTCSGDAVLTIIATRHREMGEGDREVAILYSVK